MEKITPQSKDFSAWYNDVVLSSGLADYSDVKGCMIIKPYGYALWENIQKQLDLMIKELGVQNVYLPLFIPESYFKAEAEHVKGFAPEVAWVTHAGSKKLEERLAIRPTSETVMYRTFAKWLSSYRDLPIKVNQWANVVRWEMRTRLFLRTTEFLWQEGHTLHQSKEEAAKMVDDALAMYQDFSEKFLAIKVLPGLKSESEKFPGAAHTKTIEAMMWDGKALQMGTSHLLNSEFAGQFDVQFQDEDGNLQTPWPTSWGVSTRLIGGVIMAHGDDKGLILPPNIAPIQVVVVPIWKSAEEKKTVMQVVSSLEKQLKGFRIKIDDDENKSPGWKFNDWEMKGVPLRVEIGPKDVGQNKVVFVFREGGEKKDINVGEVSVAVENALEQIQKNLFERHEHLLEEKTIETDSYDEFKIALAKDNFFVKTSWCEGSECEEKIKQDSKATPRVYGQDSPGKCVVCSKPTSKKMYFAKAY